MKPKLFYESSFIVRIVACGRQRCLVARAGIDTPPYYTFGGDGRCGIRFSPIIIGWRFILRIRRAQNVQGFLYFGRIAERRAFSDQSIRSMIARTVFDGDVVSYFKNGHMSENWRYSGGLLEGEYRQYDENGNVENACVVAPAANCPERTRHTTRTAPAEWNIVQGCRFMIILLADG